MDCDSPPPIIRYEKPPDSPLNIQYTWDEAEEAPIITPKRKSRMRGSERAPKRPKNASTLVKQSVGSRSDETRGSVAQGTAPPLPTPDAADVREPNDVANDMDASWFPLTDYDGGMGLGESEDVSSQEIRLEQDLEGGRLEQDLGGGEDPFPDFVAAVLSGECSMYQLTEQLYVVSGWNSKKQEATGSWYHMQSSNTHSEMLCLCPDADDKDVPCLHARFISDPISRTFFTKALQVDDNRCFLFYRCEEASGDSHQNLFSVPSQTRFSNVKHRAVVEHRGDDTGEGRWKCNRDPGATSCPHIVAARHSLQQHLKGDWNARDDGVREGQEDNVSYGGVYSEADGIVESVSYTPLPPPVWARIPSDPPAGPRATFKEVPSILRLDESSTCCCSKPRCMFNPLAPIIQKRCIVYTLTGAEETTIEVQKCSLCSHRFIGPDCQKVGIFNLNNRTLLAHDLLDDYSSAFSSSETPFVAWVQTVAQRYETRQCPIPFMSDKLFRQSWFSYMRLMELGTDMVCTKCGPTPDVTIWDGVTVAFSKKNLLPTLCPPTEPGPTSVARENVRLVPSLQMIDRRDLRLKMLSVLKGPKLSLLFEGGSLPGTNDPNFERNKALIERWAKIPDLLQGLRSINQSLANTFELHFGLHAVRSARVVPPVYYKFFTQLAAHENAIQFIPPIAFDGLRHFIRHPSKDAALKLRHTPALKALLHHEYLSGEIAPDTLAMCEWLYVRARATYLAMKVHNAPSPTETDVDVPAKPWLETGSCYGMPQIRDRPTYPGIIYESGLDQGGLDSTEPDVCRKYYSTYSKNRLTGGLINLHKMESGTESDYL
ncbi:hypothetical protein CVT26_012228 [Gymnopilus dilepis]|uniref:HMG domain-containing protein n=1 Tax=Gymnopilus dilepis TaxID=231916 RepID=A0A409YQ68_9AGAR|nr:hypothetical protein CVT26_012228 [Gymnopilus dilepis]